MPTLNRNFCFAVLLILVGSHAALSLHIATHVTTTGAVCQLCTGGSNPVVAIPAAVLPLVVPATEYTLNTDYAAAVASHTELSHCHPRAPPVVI